MPRSPRSTHAPSGGTSTFCTSTPFSSRCGRAASAPAPDVPLRRRLRHEGGEGRPRSLWMSTKKKFGARSGRLPRSAGADCRRSAPASPAASGPSPSDSTTDGVSAPGRWMLPIASLSAVERHRGRLRARATARAPPRCAARRSAKTDRADEDRAMRRSARTRWRAGEQRPRCPRRARHRSSRGQAAAVEAHPRNSAVAGTSRARPSGSSAKASVTSRPNSAAIASAPG